MTRVLLDTHAALWLLTGDRSLGPGATEAIEDPSVVVLLSAASVWEVAIKRGSGKLDAPDGFATTLVGGGAVPLPVDLAHAARVEHLPDHHRDPFDRLLVAQAQHEGLTLVTRDPLIARYDVATVW